MTYPRFQGESGKAKQMDQNDSVPGSQLSKLRIRFFGIQPKSSTTILRQSHTPHKSSLGRMEMAELDRKYMRPSSDVNGPQNNLWTPVQKSCRGPTQRKAISFKANLSELCYFPAEPESIFVRK